MTNNKRLFNIIWALGCIVLIEFIIIICITSSKPEPVIIEKEILVPNHVLVEKEIEPVYVYNVTSEEREMLARLVYREANTESLECQKAVVSVVINRWQNGHWGDILRDVIYAPNQFSPANMIWQTTPTEINYQAVDEVLKDGCIVPEYVMYFRAHYHFNWNGYNPYIKIDDVCFGYLNRDKK